MINFIMKILSLWAKSDGEMAQEREIARHLARVALFRWQNKDLESMHPHVAERAEKLVQRMAEIDKPIYIVEGFRDVPRQNALSGDVTNAGGLQSYHQYGLAFDIAFKGHNWNPPSHSWWEEAGKIGEELGLVWGGHFQDWGHFEYHPGFTWKELKDYFELKVGV